MPLSDEAFADLRAEWNRALPDIIAGKPDRTDLMRSLKRANERPASMREIIDVVSKETGLAIHTLTGCRSTKEIAKARTLIFFLADELRPDISRSHIADALNKDRSLVRVGLRRAAELMCSDNEFAHWYSRVRRRLGYA